jgi:DNA-directed RNA polymerase specialized sigma24 family protein
MITPWNPKLVDAFLLLQSRLTMHGSRYSLDHATCEDIASDIIRRLVGRCAGDTAAGERVLDWVTRRGLPEQFKREVRSRLHRSRSRPLARAERFVDLADKRTHVPSEARGEIEEKLGRLPARDRAVIAGLRQGDRVAEIARKQNVSCRTVQLWLKKIRNRLAEVGR